MLAGSGQPDEALTELEAVRPLLAGTFGTESTQVRNLDKQIDRLGAAGDTARGRRNDGPAPG
jgi:hypothetical protein